MAYSIPTFQKIQQLIVQEIRNKTGLTITADSDAAIRADGESSIVEGLYHHQNYIQRQLFIQTADEPFLYIHAEELGLPRSGGTRASGTVKAAANIDLNIEVGSKLTDGKSHYWSVVSIVALGANNETIVNVVADQLGASWNFSGTTLLWVSPLAGLSGTVKVISIAGGSDEEELETWRARLLERKRLGQNRSREDDLISIIKEVAGVKHIYVYPKRRGLGSVDVAITAVGNPPTLPSISLIDTAQTVLDAYIGFWADCRIYSPTEQFIPVSTIVSGQGVNLAEVEKVIKDYFAELAPAETYQVAILVARIIAISNVTDVQISPSLNVIPTVDWMYTKWLRLGALAVSST